MTAKAFLLVVILIIAASANSQMRTPIAPTVSSQSPGPNAISPAASASSDVTQRDLEIAELRGQLDTLRTFHDSIVDTVHWALAAVLGMALLLVGFNWFTSHRVAEREKQALHQGSSRQLPKSVLAN